MFSLKLSKKFSTTHLITSVFSILFFVALVVVNQMGGRVIAYYWDLTVILSAMMAVMVNHFKIGKVRIFFIILTFFTGMCNYYFVGNTTIVNQILLILFVAVSMLFTNKNVSEKVFLYMIYLNVLVVIYKFLTVGFSGAIYTNSTSNFVSIFLLEPTAIYYATLERQNKQIDIKPMCVVWVVCLLARSRGGILTSSFLLIALFFQYFKERKKSSKLFIASAAGIALFALLLNMQSFINKLSNSVMMEYFIDRGMESSRTVIWADYLSYAFADVKSFLLGGSMTRTIAEIFFLGNPHNSFINIHIHNGLIMLIAIVVLIIMNLVNAAKSKKWIYVFCFLTLVARAFTDNMFWPTYGTPVLFYFLFLPFDDISYRNATKAKVMRKFYQLIKK